MKKILFVFAIVIIIGLGFAAYWFTGKNDEKSEIILPVGELKPIQLLYPQQESGKSLMQALKNRKSARSFSRKKIPPQVLSNLLWAAFGINRPESGKRTAPSTLNWQEIDIYVAIEEGLFVYDAVKHQLQPVLSEDIRPKTGNFVQRFARKAPLTFIYVADYGRMGLMAKGMPEKEKDFFTAADTGFISQNVYLFCASEGLSTVVRAMVDRDELAATMKLRPNQKIILVQTIGYPKE